MKGTLLSTALVLAMAVPPATTAAQDVVIGAAARGSVHHDVGRAICRIVNRQGAGITCSVAVTAGWLFNLENVRVGAIEAGLARSDWQHHAVNRSGPLAFADSDYGNLRSLFSVHLEQFTVLARRDSGVRSLDDLAGRRVNLGSPGSDSRALMELVLAAKGWTRESFQLAEELPESQQSLALCHGRIQAVVLAVTHPERAVERTLGLCDAVLVNLDAATIGRVVAAHPYLSPASIPAGTYAGQDGAIATLGRRITVVSSSDVDDDLVEAVVRPVFEQLEQFRRMHPALGGLDPARMVADGRSAPLHPGAARYFRTRGLM